MKENVPSSDIARDEGSQPVRIWKPGDETLRAMDRYASQLAEHKFHTGADQPLQPSVSSFLAD
jgi:hypothetical protein